MNWYQLTNESEIDSPSLLVYKDRVAANIQQMIDFGRWARLTFCARKDQQKQR